MRSRLLTITLAAGLLSGPAFADHNSKWGEGWANMPNDIHNTRIDTSGDDTAFRDFVRYGNGADSDNRFSSSEFRVGQRSGSKAQRQQSTSRQGRRRER